MALSVESLPCGTRIVHGKVPEAPSAPPRVIATIPMKHDPTAGILAATHVLDALQHGSSCPRTLVTVLRIFAESDTDAPCRRGPVPLAGRE